LTIPKGKHENVRLLIETSSCSYSNFDMKLGSS